MPQRTLFPRAVLLTALLLACLLVQDGLAPPHPPAPTAAEAPNRDRTVTAGPGGQVRPAAGHSPPVRIRIPVIDVDAPVQGLGLDRDRHLLVPDASDRNLAGWYQDWPSPGEAGNAILSGHVDTTAGPAVFWNLATLRRGDLIRIERADRSTAVFGIDAVEAYTKAGFPDARVYSPTPDAQLRLITCGGTYSRQTGYQGNVVVYAHLTALEAA
ncbi:class F sortase [Kitasatospora sp. NPDC050543]|uniref:class F sortase n=1 Tax=Kitasatospora sp. NPDC050543 TaxID=3364054 RepID=UPI003792A071